MAGGGSTREKLFRRDKVRRRYAKGQTPQEIADALEVKLQTITADLTAIALEGAQLARKPTIEQAARQLERIEEIWRTSWESFAQSKGDIVITTLRADEMEEYDDHETGRKGQRPKNPKSTLTRKKSAGDPRFLERAGWAWLQYCELIGLINKRAGNASSSEQDPKIGEVGMVVYMPQNGRDPHLQNNNPEKK